MVRDFILAFPYLIVAAIAWFGRTYLAKRVSEAARGAVDISVGQKLADYNHGLDRRLEEHRSSLAAQGEEMRKLVLQEHERFTRDYSLYAEERNRAYAITYAEFEKTFGSFSRHFADFTEERDFSRSPELDLRDLAERLELVSVAERNELKQLLDTGETREAGTLATKLHKRDALRQANRTFVQFRNSTILNSLYFSEEVMALVEQVVVALAPFSVYADELIENGTIEFPQRRELSKRVAELRALGAKLRTHMQQDMRSGFLQRAPGA